MRQHCNPPPQCPPFLFCPKPSTLVSSSSSLFSATQVGLDRPFCFINLLWMASSSFQSHRYKGISDRKEAWNRNGKSTKSIELARSLALSRPPRKKNRRSKAKAERERPKMTTTRNRDNARIVEKNIQDSAPSVCPSPHPPPATLGRGCSSPLLRMIIQDPSSSHISSSLFELLTWQQRIPRCLGI